MILYRRRDTTQELQFLRIHNLITNTAKLINPKISTIEWGVLKVRQCRKEREEFPKLEVLEDDDHVLCEGQRSEMSQGLRVEVFGLICLTCTNKSSSQPEFLRQKVATVTSETAKRVLEWTQC